MQLEEIALVGNALDKLAHVIRTVRIFRHQRVERKLDAVGGIGRRAHRHAGFIGKRQKIKQPAHLQQRLDIVVIGQIRHAGFLGMRIGATQFFLCHHLVRHGFDHVGAGDEHIGAAAHHDDKIGQRRRIDRTARAWPHDHGNLRNDAARQHVALENLGKSAQAVHTFLNARTAGIEQADHGCSDFDRHIHDLANLLRVGFGKRAAENGEILAVDEDDAAVDGAVTGDAAVAGDFLVVHVEVGAAMLDEHVVFLEGIRIHQHVDALARGELALGVLRFDAHLAAALAGAVAFLLEFGNDGSFGHRRLRRDQLQGRFRG